MMLAAAGVAARKILLAGSAFRDHKELIPEPDARKGAE